LKSALSFEKFLILHVGDESLASADEKELLLRCENRNKIIRYGHEEEILSILEHAHVFALPSLHEGFSVALAEALSIGLPCVISEITGTSWAQNLPGVLVAKSDDQWKSILQNLTFVQIEKLTVEAESSREGFQFRFSASRGVSEYNWIYRQ
jgi:glycosyltransferase involved in cell wall biosynthesis